MSAAAAASSAAAPSSSAGVASSPAAHSRPAAAAAAAASAASVDLTDDAPPADNDDDLDALIELEANLAADEAAADEAGGGGGGGFEEEEGGGFFPDDNSSAQAAAAAGSDAHTAAGSSSTAAAASHPGDPDSLEANEPAREFASGCRECGSIGIQQTYLEAFNVRVCFRCQRTHLQRYKLLTQTTATTEYMLPLSAVQQLGYIEKKNPHKQAWGAMKLYWREQVLALVRERFPSRAALEEAKRERDLVKIRKEDARRRSAHQSSAREAAFTSTVAASMSQLGGQTPAEVVEMLAARTRGMAPISSERAKAKASGGRQKRKSGAAADEEPNDPTPDEHDPLAGLTPAARKRAKQADAAQAAAKKKQLHTHRFKTVADGQQRCDCGFVMEFETL